MKQDWFNKFLFYSLILSLAFFTAGKFLYFSILLIMFIVVFERGLRAWERDYFLYFLIVIFLFHISFYVGALKGNSLQHMLRNNYFSIYYFLFPYVLISTLNYGTLRNVLAKINFSVFLICTAHIFIYVAALLSPKFHVFFDTTLVGRLGYAFGFAGAAENGLKVYSNLTSLIIFCLGIEIFFYKRRLLIGILIVTIGLSASITQYFILLLFLTLIASEIIMRFFLKLRLHLGHFLIGIAGAISMIVLIVNLGLFGLVQEKIEGFNQSQSFNTVSIRKDQAEILIHEAEAHLPFGAGLGYESPAYSEYRKGFGDTKELNQSMYENQYLDVLMKFGFLAAFIAILYILLPSVFLIINSISNNDFGYLKVLFTYYGVLLYSGSNGNTFYMYSTMIVWGIVMLVCFKGLNNEGR
ncbi:hypothetical protein EGC76_01700 [Pseudidiomarina gelatinasegens]|uniref:O-antigen ligase domain-containing protein n=1 Tax=Pseudidiomarina gelatinasegens TaxID=2487740 RepID=A0A443Z7P3_9GAMM|nr:hypothetical protein [Pseudidiomarina gelatinasegens]RWU12953.1 hypothetical protein EGC76_01700 [Pseudidiomarina gelatinasegens]